MLTFRVVVVGDDRRAPAFQLKLARAPRIGQLLELPPRGGLVTVVLPLPADGDDVDGVLIANTDDGAWSRRRGRQPS